jgi:hypothetical protein
MAKRFLEILLILTISLSIPFQANADDNWDKYLQAKDRFYSLDKQEFNKISCKVEVSQLKTVVNQIYTQFKPFKDKIEIKENLEDFSLTYIRNGEINFNCPSIDIKIISEKGATDPDKLKEGIEKYKVVFKQAVDGAVTELKSFFEEFQTPQKDAYKIKEISNGKTTYTAKYEKDGNNFTETFSNKQLNTKEITKNGYIASSVDNYKKIADNKLFLTNSQTIIKMNATDNVEMNMVISYEKIKNVLFPTHQKVKVKGSVQGAKFEGPADTYLTNCIIQ